GPVGVVLSLGEGDATARFIKGIAGSTAGWSFAARAQQGEQVRRISVLINRAADDLQGQARVTAFRQALQQLGWIEGRNVRMDIRWGKDNGDLERKYAKELFELAPDIFLTSGTLGVAALQQLTRSLPIVFAAVADPVGGGFVGTLSRPG